MLNKEKKNTSLDEELHGDALLEEIRRYSLSPEGAEKLKQGREKAQATIDYLREAGRIDPDMLRRPYTI